jgi:hypothetical protein
LEIASGSPGDPELFVVGVQPLTPTRQPFPLVLLRTRVLNVTATDERHLSPLSDINPDS